MDANPKDKKERSPLPNEGRVKKKGLKLKICGMKFPENIQQIAALQPEYLGFIFFEKSPRNFDAVIPKIDQDIKKTGVFVDASLEFVLEKVSRHQLQAVQLHGKETPEFCATLKAEGLEVIKVFSVKDSFDFSLLEQYEGKVNFFLFDTKGKAKGGNGIIFDWKILENYPSKTPFFLSGGIGLVEIGRLEEFDFPKTFYGIDVNSRFEAKPGLKNVENLKGLKSKIAPQG